LNENKKARSGDSFGDPAHSLIFLEQKNPKIRDLTESHLTR
jgi:hypothetical protein